MRLSRNAKGQVLLFREGHDAVEDVRIARCFPWSLPEEYISIRDAKGKEVVLLRSLDDLDPASRTLALDELREKVFNPRITAVLDFKDEFGITSIRAKTDRGEVTFQIRSRDDIRMLGPARALFRDADGNTYELPDFDQLDPASRQKLSRYF